MHPRNRSCVGDLLECRLGSGSFHLNEMNVCSKLTTSANYYISSLLSSVRAVMMVNDGGTNVVSSNVRSSFAILPLDSLATDKEAPHCDVIISHLELFAYDTSQIVASLKKMHLSFSGSEMLTSSSKSRTQSSITISALLHTSLYENESVP